MKPVSVECVSSDRSCKDCRLDGCNCECHHGRSWKTLLKEHNQRRYYVGHGKSGVWYVMDRGTLANPSTRVVAECGNRMDAHKMALALNKENR